MTRKQPGHIQASTDRKGNTGRQSGSHHAPTQYGNEHEVENNIQDHGRPHDRSRIQGMPHRLNDIVAEEHRTQKREERDQCPDISYGIPLQHGIRPQERSDLPRK